ncbi:hypothetical protein [Bdellovibrio sp. HCB2-146]|uniref:hypothetical protein n=1 Tax=Bdellovibrio sp. HCB2-146 TaxID=3394362 RepID=UPI0039BD28BD
MKNLLLVSLVFLSVISATQAFAGDHCRRQDNRCEQNFRRADIYKELLTAEGGDVNDAKAGLETIDALSRDLGSSLNTTAANYIYILNLLGGSYYTQTTKSTILSISAYVNRNYQLADIVDYFADIYQAENRDVNDARIGLETAWIVAKTNRISLSKAVGLHIKLLNLLGGSYYTETTRTIYAQLANHGRYYPETFPIEDVYRAYVTLYEAENRDVNDAMTDLDVVMKGALACGNLQEALQEFTSILNSLGGSYYTQTAQKTYRDIFGL